ncbi:MAG: glycerol-3-phosphate 1-O-acyltransferase PlsY [Thermodesulfovibrionia bacterium]
MTQHHLLLYLLIPLAYIMGSVPFGIIISKRSGVDIRGMGSGNIGATNVLRTMGKVPALLTLMGDALKGAIPVLICRLILNTSNLGGGELWEGLVGLMAILGHMYPAFLSFKGGKGVATSLGVFIVYAPISTVFAILIWLLVAVITRYSSLSAIIASICLTFFILFFDGFSIKIYFSVFIAIMIISKHRDNIKRLLKGTEHRFGGRVAD